jgi:hypothetical protein
MPVPSAPLQRALCLTRRTAAGHLLASWLEVTCAAHSAALWSRPAPCVESVYSLIDRWRARCSKLLGEPARTGLFSPRTQLVTAMRARDGGQAAAATRQVPARMQY